MRDKPFVATRRVHYFSGFDPRGAAYYHRLLKEQAARPQPSGAQVEVGKRRRRDKHFHHWPVTWRASQQPTVHTEHVFMSWDDIIRDNWSKSPWALLREFFFAYRGIVFDVDLRRVKKLNHPVYLTGIMPAIFLLGSIAAGGLLAALLSVWVNAWLALALGGALTYAVGRYGQHQGLFWLLRIFTYVVRMGQRPIAGMAERRVAWVEHVIQRQQAEPVDEVLLVGHSVGTIEMIEAVDLLLQDPRWQALQQGCKTQMLTLGQCLPFVSLVPPAGAFRATLARLCRHPQLDWLDVTALIDPLCFHMAHPLALTDLDAPDYPLPRRVAARFFPMYEPQNWAHIRRDKLMTHFLYLMTPDRAGNFSFYDMLYGPQPLGVQMNQH